MAEVTLPDGARLGYEIHGSGSPVMLVQATSLSAAFWPPPVLDALAADHQVIVYDHRGMGSSSPIAADDPRPVSTRSLATDAAMLLDQLGVGPTHVLGYSLGSAVAQELALSRPDLVASLVLSSTWAQADGFQRALLTALRSAWLHADLTAGLAGLGLAYSPEFLDDPAFAAVLETVAPSLPHTPEQIAMTARQWEANLTHDTLERLPTITVPSTVLVGEQDVLTPPRQARKVADRLPASRYVLLEGPGSSHALMTERTEEWLGHVREHLGRLR